MQSYMYTPTHQSDDKLTFIELNKCEHIHVHVF